MKLGAWCLKLDALRPRAHTRPGSSARAAIDIDPPSLVKQLSANDLIRIPRGNFLMFTIFYILYQRIPTSSAAAALVVIVRGWTASTLSRDC